MFISGLAKVLIYMSINLAMAACVCGHDGGLVGVAEWAWSRRAGGRGEYPGRATCLLGRPACGAAWSHTCPS